MIFSTVTGLFWNLFLWPWTKWSDLRILRSLRLQYILHNNSKYPIIARLKLFSLPPLHTWPFLIVYSLIRSRDPQSESPQRSHDTPSSTLNITYIFGSLHASAHADPVPPLLREGLIYGQGSNTLFTEQDISTLKMNKETGVVDPLPYTYLTDSGT